jgi:hypothetical protein
MISPEDVRELSASKETQCLTAYLNTDASLGRTGYLATFKNLIRVLATSITNGDRKVFDKVVEKASNALTQSLPNGNSTLVFASERTWHQFSSRVPVRNEAWWGSPNVNQLLWLLEEYRPYGVLIADQQKVRFLAVRLNEFEEYKEFSTEVETADWKRQRLGNSGRGNAFQKGGTDFEGFNSRFMEHIHSFWRTLHKPLTDLVERYHIQKLVVAGNKSLVPEFTKSLPQRLSSSVITQIHTDAFISPADAVKRIWPEIEKWELKRSQGIVSELLSFASVGSKAAIGLESSLKHIQDGRASRLVVAKGYDREISQCLKCSYVTTNHASACQKCSATDVTNGALANVLPKLVVRHSLPVEIVKGAAADELNKSGGVGVYLRF